MSERKKLEPFSLFDEPLEFDAIVYHEVPEPEGGWQIPEYELITEGPFRALTAEEIDALK